jgi:orotidine-5'-phosphate decarboxylase
VPTADTARALVSGLGDAVEFYKVGLELLATDGMALARELKAQGKSVFLDWKLHDIGETVRRATAALAAKLALRGLVVTPAHRLASDVELQCRRDFYRHHIGEGYAGASG